MILPESILQRLRFPKFLLHANETLGAEVRGTSAVHSRRIPLSAVLILPPLLPCRLGGECVGGAVGTRAPHTSSDDGESSCQGRRRSVFCHTTLASDVVCTPTYTYVCMHAYTCVRVFRTHALRSVFWISCVAYRCTDHTRNVMMKECVRMS